MPSCKTVIKIQFLVLIINPLVDSERESGYNYNLL